MVFKDGVDLLNLDQKDGIYEKKFRTISFLSVIRKPSTNKKNALVVCFKRIFKIKDVNNDSYFS